LLAEHGREERRRVKKREKKREEVDLASFFLTEDTFGKTRGLLPKSIT